LAYKSSRSVKKCDPGRVAKKAKKEKRKKRKKEKKLRDVIS